MANNYFQFQKFMVFQERCAMKVGTDGTLLGAWSHGGKTILDIGTGTGLIALMMAQRFPDSQVVGIDIDSEAVMQATGNFAGSPFGDRMSAVCEDVKTFNHQPFEAIVCNPPFFVDSLTCPDKQRSIARHTTMLNYEDLMKTVKRLLADRGEFSVVIPFDCKSKLEETAAIAGFFKIRECSVRTTPRKRPRRYLMAFGKHPLQIELTDGVIESLPGVRSPWYHELTKDFYL